MFLAKVKKLTAVLLALGVLAFGGSLLPHLTATGERARAEPAPAAAEGPPAKAGEKPEASTPADDKVRALMKKRLATLREIAAETEKIFTDTGRLPPQDVVQAKIQILLAELDLCASDRERVEVREKLVTRYKELEEIADARVKAGHAQHLDLLRAQVDRLNAEIALEQERARAAGQQK